MDDPSGQIRVFDLICKGMEVVQRVEGSHRTIAPIRVVGRWPS
jgi:hypothetical protein